jgi:hypothetical protein
MPAGICSAAVLTESQNLLVGVFFLTSTSDRHLAALLMKGA